LDGVAATRVLAWYALRAGRPSWPNQFSYLIRGATAALEDALDLFSDDIAEVRVAIKEKDRELEDGESYHVAVFFVVDEDTWNIDIEGRSAINAAFAQFAGELDACAGVEVNQEVSGVVPGSEFTWQDTKQTDLWDFANLSHHD
jgi:wobble nucleotide-excising tRNase